MTTFRETGQAGVGERAQGPERKPRAWPSRAAAWSTFMCPLELAQRTQCGDCGLSLCVSLSPSPSPLLVPSSLSIGKDSKWQGDQGLSPYPHFFSILIHFQSLAVNTIYVLTTPKFKSPLGPPSLTVDTSNYLLNMFSQHIIKHLRINIRTQQSPLPHPKALLLLHFSYFSKCQLPPYHSLSSHPTVGPSTILLSLPSSCVPNPTNSHLLCCSPSLTHHYLWPGSLQWSFHCCPYPSLASCPHNSKILLEYKSLLSLLC